MFEGQFCQLSGNNENQDGFFASAITEVERRGDQWVVTRLDRSKEKLPEGELGLKQLA